MSNEIRRNNAKVVQKQLERQTTGSANVENKQSAQAQKFSARQRALEFAKNIPKPTISIANDEVRYQTPKQDMEKGSGLSELDRLVMQHEQDTQQIQSIRNQLERQLKVSNF